MALGGGGVRGLAHVGILRVLNSHSLSVDLIVGTSIGAIIGGAYCLNPDVNLLEEKILKLISYPEIKRLESFFMRVSEENQKKFIIQKLLSRIKNLYLWNLHVSKKWLIRTEPISEVLKKLFENKKFSDAQIPFACVAVDLNTASDVIIKKGRMLEAILASSAIPGIFAPYRRNEQLLIDGGVLSQVPARQARILGADFVIGVDLSVENIGKDPINGMDILFQSDWIKSHYIHNLNLCYCDIVIKPNVLNLSWTSFSKGPFCIKQGELAALREIDKIKEILVKRRRFYFIKKLFKTEKTHVE